jgi:hypothetical protein
MPGDRALEGALLFGYFLLGKQEKVTRSRCERKLLLICEAYRAKAKAKALGPGFPRSSKPWPSMATPRVRRDDERWEAFADGNQDQTGFRPSPE